MSTSATSSISSMLNSRTRISGMSSGLDVDSLVEKLMKVETAKVDKVKQQKTYLGWQKEAYRSFTTALTALKNKYFNVTSSSNLFSKAAFKRTVAVSSNTSVASVSGSTADVTSHTLKVVNLATVGAVTSTNPVATMAGKTDLTTVKLTDLDSTWTEGTDILSISGVSTPYKAGADETVADFLNKVNNDVNNKAYTLSYNASTEKFVVTSKSIGQNTATISGAFLSGTDLPASITGLGLDAKYTLDGIDGYTSKTNEIKVDGMSVTMIAEGSTNISATKDIDGMVKNIQEFITDYNKIISDINTKTSEKKNRDYTPLTDDQKSAMKDADITAWEAKAKEGILQNDNLLNGLGDKLKRAMYDKYTLSDGDACMADIGIGTTSRYDMGVLTVNETKLRAALNENPDKVIELFTKESETPYSPDGYATGTSREDNGVLANISDILNDYVRTYRNSRGDKGFLLQEAGTINDTTDSDNYIQKLIKEKEDEITDLTSKLTEKEDYYYRKFTAMETAISNMNSQASFLSSLSGSSK